MPVYVSQFFFDSILNYLFFFRLEFNDELHYLGFGIGMEIFRFLGGFLGGILGEYTRTFLASFVFLNNILDTASQLHLLIQTR
jgi:hypothetical protein